MALQARVVAIVHGVWIEHGTKRSISRSLCVVLQLSGLADDARKRSSGCVFCKAICSRFELGWVWHLILNLRCRVFEKSSKERVGRNGQFGGKRWKIGIGRSIFAFLVGV